MRHIEKTVFISYRRANVAWAIAIFQNLTHHGYDVFFDYNGIEGGDFEQAILGNIDARAHFLILLTPSALDRCNEPDDWLRREIEHAISARRNIVPLMLERFKFDSPRTKKHLTGTLTILSRYNGLEVYPALFNETMRKLRDNRLNVTLAEVTHPASPIATQVASEQQAAARTASPIRETELTAEELFNSLNRPNDLKTDKRAVRWFRKAAETGNPHGMAGLGFMYGSGRGGLPRDDVKAVHWYRKGADGGAARAMAGLSFMYRNGRGGLPKDDVQAVSWSRRAADAGDPRGMTNLGWMYRNGRGGLAKDDVQAVRWFRKAADAGDVRGMTNLAFMYRNGRGGLPQDDIQAVNWLRRAADAGDARGMTNLGWMYRNGCGGLAQDDEQAVIWFRKAADAGDARGMTNLGWMYETGRGGLRRDDRQAVSWFRKAADAGDKIAKVHLKRPDFLSLNTPAP